MKRIAIPDAETFIAAIQDELSITREGLLSACRCLARITWS
ncbi:hypothetical protein ACFLYL_03200 [Chloroflexota bacterium]